MTNITVNVTKWYHLALGVVPVVAALVSAVLWIDARYMQRFEYELMSRAAYSQSVELQYMMVEGRLQAYEQLKKNGGVFTAEQEVKHKDYLNRYEDLTAERSRLMSGIGVNP